MDSVDVYLMEHHQATLPPPKPLFYIQNRGFCGDCLRWWKADRCGYTLNLDQAWKGPQEEAAEICRSRPQEDIAWPVLLIDSVAARHVNNETLKAKLQEEKRSDDQQPIEALARLLGWGEKDVRRTIRASTQSDIRKEFRARLEDVLNLLRERI